MADMSLHDCENSNFRNNNLNKPCHAYLKCYTGI